MQFVEKIFTGMKSSWTPYLVAKFVVTRTHVLKTPNVGSGPCAFRFLFPHKTNIFKVILESICLSVRMSVCPSAYNILDSAKVVAGVLSHI